jgi:hypothetical protein
MSRSSVIAGVTFASVACSAVVSLAWFSSVSGSAGSSPTVQTLGLLAGITGVLAQRRASARERRHLTLASLNAELHSSELLADCRAGPPITVAALGGAGRGYGGQLRG